MQSSPFLPTGDAADKLGPTGAVFAASLVREVLDTIPNLVAVRDRRGRYTLVNHSLAATHGLTPAGMLGRTQYDLLSDAARVAEWRRTDLETMDTLQDVFVPEELFLDRAGKELWFQSHKRPIIDPDGVARQVLVVSTDVTSRHLAQIAASRLAAIVESSTDAILSTDLAGRIDIWNPAAERMFGYGREEIIGHNVSTLYPTGLSSEGSALLAAIRRGERVAQARQVQRRKDGTLVDATLTVFPVRNIDGETIGVSVIAHDVSEIRRANDALQQSEQRLAEAQRLAAIGSWTQDLGTGEVTWSAETRRQLGYLATNVRPSLEAMVARIDPIDRPVVEQTLRAAAVDQTALDYEYRLVDADGKMTGIYHARAQIVCDAGGDPLRLTGTTQDISSRKAAETAVAAAQKAEAASQARSDFLANLTHEIRTPMNGVLGMLELLMDGPLDPAQRELTRVARTSAESLLTIVNDILDFSNADAGRLTLSHLPFDLREALDDTVSRLALRARRSGLAFALAIDDTVPTVVTGDGARLCQLLVNVVGNAIKFTPEGQVTVRISAGARSAHQVMLEVSVHDTGIGIAVDRQAAVFEPFAQGDGSTTRPFGGTGLGLTIARQVVTAMGGRLWLESVPEVGSTFFFAIPLGIDTPTPRSTVLPTLPLMETPVVPVNSAGVAPGRVLRVLVVDDNDVNRLFAGAVLRRWGHTVDAVHNGREAVEEMSRGEFDLVLMDLQMPILGGLEATAEIRQIEQGTGRHTRIVALTAGALSGDRDSCVAAGMEGYLTKPLRTEALAELVAGLGGLTPASDDRR